MKLLGSLSLGVLAVAFAACSGSDVGGGKATL
jgi:hypothetical protein